MNNNDHFDAVKRHTLKALASVTATSIVASPVAIAKVLPDIAEPAGVSCQLIYRDDGSRTYLLIHNETKHDVSINQFLAQNVRFGARTLNMAEAFTKPVTVVPQDRILVRLAHKSGSPKRNMKYDIDLPVNQKYPTVGTRVVDLPVFVHQNVGVIDRAAVLRKYHAEMQSLLA